MFTLASSTSAVKLMPEARAVLENRAGLAEAFAAGAPPGTSQLQRALRPAAQRLEGGLARYSV